MRDGDVFLKKVGKAIADFIRYTDKILLLLCVFASSYGILLVYSATRYTLKDGQWISGTSKTMIMAVLLGIFCAFIISLIDYDVIVKLWSLIALVAGGLMVLTLFIGRGPENGADDTAWLVLPGGIYFQPSELGKIGFIITFSVHLNKVKEHISSFPTVLLLGLHACIPLLLVMKNGDDGSAILFLFIAALMMFAAGIKLIYFIIGGVLAVGGFAAAWLLDLIPTFQKNRFMVVFDPSFDPQNFAFQQNQSLAAIGSGQIWGKGLFQGNYTQRTPKNFYVPENQNDFIFSVSGEELGLVGCVVLILVLLAICLRVLSVGFKAKNNTGFLICSGIAGMILSQSFLNIGMCLKLLPVIGITLPFFSSGGSSNVCIYLGIGLIFSIYRSSMTGYNAKSDLARYGRSYHKHRI